MRAVLILIVAFLMTQFFAQPTLTIRWTDLDDVSDILLAVVKVVLFILDFLVDTVTGTLGDFTIPSCVKTLLPQ